jgi:hypothetical protein
MTGVKEHLHRRAPSAGPRFERTAAIVRAVEAGDADAVARLLSDDPSLAKTTVYVDAPGGTTLLHRAAWYGSPGHLAAAGLLLDRGAGVELVGPAVLTTHGRLAARRSQLHLFG